MAVWMTFICGVKRLLDPSSQQDPTASPLFSPLVIERERINF
jgi:hypothetical protein